MMLLYLVVERRCEVVVGTITVDWEMVTCKDVTSVIKDETRHCEADRSFTRPAILHELI